MTPPVRAGVELVTGLFNETLGPFLEANAGDVMFLNIDNDLYEGALSSKLMVRTPPGSDRVQLPERELASFPDSYVVL